MRGGGWCSAYLSVGGPVLDSKLSSIRIRDCRFSSFLLLRMMYVKYLMALREVFCISCLSLGDVMPKSLRMSTIDWCMVPRIHVVIMIGGRPFQLSSWRWGIREPYLSCLRVVAK